MATLSLICITGVSAADAGTAQTQTGNTSTVQENDSTPPTITSTDPAHKATNVAINVIKVTFSESIKAGSNWIELYDTNRTIIPITTSINGNVLTITPKNNLTPGTTYSTAIHTGSLTDLSGNPIALCGSTFTTDGTAPTIKSTDPAHKATNVPINKVIKVTFSESIKAGSNWIELYDTNKTIIPITTSINGNVLTITPKSNLTPGTTYSTAIHTGSLTDLSGNPIALCGSTFTTDGTAPTIKSVDPANGAGNVPLDKTIKVTFSESIKAGTLWIELISSTGTKIPITISTSGNVLTVNPNSNLAKGTKYTLTLHTGSVTDLSGNNIVLCGSSFTTTGVPPELQPYLEATANCQVNNAQIKSLAASLTNGITSAYDKAVKIFNWVNANTSYDQTYYRNTKYGAVGTLNRKIANCCDLSHLLIALTRAAGIPARYVHGDCTFSSGRCGHVWAQVWVNGKWYVADVSSNLNTFNVIKNWNTATATIHGYYRELPF